MIYLTHFMENLKAVDKKGNSPIHFLFCVIIFSLVLQLQSANAGLNVISGDLSGDGDVDFGDFAKFASEWRNHNCINPCGCEGGDLDNDTDVDFSDAAIIAEHWLEGTTYKDYFVGAYYYPWYNGNNFHGPDPKGSTTLVYHLNPRMTPQLGFYDQNDSDISQHFNWARYAGINFFVTSYWGSGSGEDLVIRNQMFNNPDRGDIKLAVFLEPSITPVDHVVTPAQITSQTNYLCDNYFNQPGYLRYDNKPVIFIYVTRAMTDPNLTMCISTIRAAAIDKGIGEVYIVGDEVWGSPNIGYETPRVSQMDAVTNYDVYGNLGGARFVTDSILDNWQNRNTSWKNFANSLGKQFIGAVSPGFNDRGVRYGHQPSSRKLNSEDNVFGTLFSGMLDRVTDSGDTNEMIMVTSWNEWHEDTQIEPVTTAPATNLDDGGSYYTDGLYYNGYGTLYLDILREKTTMLTLGN